jgi:hypothetical protein
MKKEPLIRLTWRGHETIALIPRLLDQTEQVEIALPADYNHALFHALNPDAPPSAPEDIDASGGPELLADIARIRGLEELATLTGVLSKVQASVRLVSPPTLVIDIPSAKPTQE